MIARALLLFVAATALAWPGSPARAEPSEESFAAFDRYLAAFREETMTPSLSVVIVHDGRIAWEGYYGWSDDEGDVPTGPETTYKIASTTKPIAATAIIAESLSGGVSLDLPMAADPGWADTCDWLSSSAIPFGGGGTQGDGSVVAAMDCDRKTTLRDILDMRANGDDFVYNPIAFARIDRAIEGGGGRPLRAIVRDRVANPAGMTDVALGWRDPDGGDALRFLAPPFHVVDGRATKQPLPEDDFRAAAGIIASPRAMAAFDIAFDSGLLLPPTLNQTLIDHEIGPDGDYRAGWYLEDWHGERLLWHSGWNEKKGSAIYLKVPSRKLTLIALANTESLWWGNSLVRAEIHRSPIAARFLEEFAR